MAAANSTPLLSVRDISVAFNGHNALENISFDVEKPEFIAIIGPNGGGKTTLLKTILGLLEPTSGTLSVLGQSAQSASSRLGYVPQFSETDPAFPICVKEVILMGTLSGFPLFPRYHKKDVEHMNSVARQLDITDLLPLHYGSLSGGQKQRVLIARALVSHPEMLLLDEPVASVDSRSEHDIYRMLSEYSKQIPVIMVTHDIGAVSTLVDRIICINRVIYDNPHPETTMGEPIKEYGDNVKVVVHHCGL